jgi:NAD(P)-dependent dehydrogenase (short-subunit alcohol dehydrogenase family)
MFAALNKPVRDWRNQRIWLVGASSGIGAALAQALLARGAQVAVSARREASLREAVKLTPQALVLPMDVQDPSAWQPAHAKLIAAFGGIDLVIFCAARYKPERSWEMLAEDAAQTLEVNLHSVYQGISTVLPTLMQQQSGGIAIVASVAGYMGLPNASVYGPSKAALINLAELLYCDLHSKGLNLSLIHI